MSGGKSAFLDPGGYATHEGGLDDARGRLRTLTRLFLRAHWRGTRLRLFLTSFLMTPAHHQHRRVAFDSGERRFVTVVPNS